MPTGAKRERQSKGVAGKSGARGTKRREPSAAARYAVGKRAKAGAKAVKVTRASRTVQARPSGRGRTSAKGPPSAVGSARRTRDHDEIRGWVERHGGCPAAVKATSKAGVGILRIDFPGYSGKMSLEQISWDDFFKKFDESGLEFLYQERTKSGRPSRFNKLVTAEA